MKYILPQTSSPNSTRCANETIDVSI